MGTVTVPSDAPNSPNLTALRGTGIAGLIDLSLSLAFPATLVDNQSTTVKTATLSNPNAVALTVDSIAATGDFGIITSTGANPCNISGATILRPKGSSGSSCTVGVAFTPTAQGIRTGTLQITSNARNATESSPGTIKLQGTGTLSAPTFTPKSLSFGKVTVGVASPPQTFTMTNNNPIAMTIDSVTSSKGDYTASQNCLGILNPGVGGACTVSVTFAPSVTGADNGTISIKDNAGTGTQKIGVYGSGYLTAPTLSSKTLAFGKETVGDTTAAQTLTVTNPNTVPMDFGTATISSDYQISGDTCSGNSIGAGAFCTISVIFTPTAKRAFRGSLHIFDNAGAVTSSTATQSVSLTGTGD